jgi:type III secretion protein R
MPLVVLCLFLLYLFAQSASVENFDQFDSSILHDPFYLLFFLIGVALLPFLAVMMTSFAKIVVVLSIARQAIGTAQTPSNIIIMSLAMILTCFSMYPMAIKIFENIDPRTLENAKGAEKLRHLTKAFETPMRNFLHTHARQEDQDLFLNLMKEGKNEDKIDVKAQDFIILAPAFLISELSLAFQIGFLIYLPFLVIDMTVANLLMALGMQMLAPTTISLPFKILLFVLVDGWHLLSEGLVKV